MLVRTSKSERAEGMDAHGQKGARIETCKDREKWSVNERTREAYVLCVSISRMSTTITTENTNGSKAYCCKYSVRKVMIRWSR